MPSISEKDLAVFISLLSGKIAAMKRKLREPEAILEDNLANEQINDQYELQETIEQYKRILDDVREEYEAALVDGINLPSFEALTAANSPENNMKKQKQESKQTLTAGDAFYQWIPYAAAGVIFVLHLIAAMIRKNMWMVVGGQLLALAVFLIVRMAFPRPDASRSAN